MKRYEQIEQSQIFIADKYDQVLETIKTTNLQPQGTGSNIAKLSTTVVELTQKPLTKDATIDDIQQYLR